MTMHHQQKWDLVPTEESVLIEKQFGFGHVKVEVKTFKWKCPTVEMRGQIQNNYYKKQNCKSSM